MSVQDIPRPTPPPPAVPDMARTVRVPDELWEKAAEIAAREGIKGGVSEVIRHYLRHYVDTAVEGSP